MSTSKAGGKTGITALLTATAASLCCITPVLALISGASGIASAFLWIEPYRPYLSGITVVALGLAWYQKLKPRKADIDCACEEDKPSFWQSKTFLGMVTALAILLLTFPKYAHIFYPRVEKKEIIVVDKSSVQQLKLNITGMTCEACTLTVNLALSKIPGVLEYKTEYKNSASTVKFDNSKTGEQDIINAVNETGYKVTNAKPVQ